jgi:hypothetical protein
VEADAAGGGEVLRRTAQIIAAERKESKEAEK